MKLKSIDIYPLPKCHIETFPYCGRVHLTWASCNHAMLQGQKSLQPLGELLQCAWDKKNSQRFFLKCCGVWKVGWNKKRFREASQNNDFLNRCGGLVLNICVIIPHNMTTYSLQNLLFFWRYGKNQVFFKKPGFSESMDFKDDDPMNWYSWRCSKVNTLRASTFQLTKPKNQAMFFFHFKNAESVLHMCSYAPKGKKNDSWEVATM